MATYRLKAEDVDPLLEGLGHPGDRRRSSPEWGREILQNDLERGRSLEIIDPDDLPDSSLVVSGGIMGSVKTFEQIGVKELVQRWETDFELLRATRTMEHYLHRSVDYVVPFEVGGLNTPVILSLASRLGTAAVNGDALGRSAPETQMTSFIMHGISLTPMPLVDAAGNAIVVTEQDQPTFADEIGRWMVTRGGGWAPTTTTPMSGADLKRTVVPGTITQAMEIGRALQRARAAGEDPVAGASAVLGARPLFTGVVAAVTGEDVGGFYITNVILEGRGGLRRGLGQAGHQERDHGVVGRRSAQGRLPGPCVHARSLHGTRHHERRDRGGQRDGPGRLPVPRAAAERSILGCRASLVRWGALRSSGIGVRSHRRAERGEARLVVARRPSSQRRLCQRAPAAVGTPLGILTHS